MWQSTSEVGENTLISKGAQTEYAPSLHSAYCNYHVSFMQAVVVQRLLIYTEEEEVELWYGIVLVVCIFILQIIRISGDVFFWSFSCRTACRLRSGILTVTFRRLAHLRSLKQHSVGEVRE